MSELYVCQKCGDTFFVYEGDLPVCSKCKAKLVEMCEWCGSPEKDCKCGKDEINVE